MEFNIKQEFVGIINAVEINDKQTYYHTIELLETIEAQHDVDFTPEFVKSYANEFQDISNDFENATLSDIENELERCTDVGNVADIEFICFGYAFEWTNKMIKEGNAFIKK